ncbi:MAG: fucose isomerase [Acidimicrobiia bacterium]|nr:fucose isomerase [Acidimicrobiia bacterium]MDX2468406.1 fucose isomerase [Acidimicrobiia bacterium]
MNSSKKTVGVIALARPTFDVPYAQEVAAAAMETLRELDAELIGNADLLFDAETTETALGQFEGVDLDALLLLQVSFTDSSMTEAIGARFDAPIILWSFPEERTGGRLRLNSFCGLNLAAYALINAGSDFGYVHRYADDAAAVGDIEQLLAGQIGQPPTRRRSPKETSTAAAAVAMVAASKLSATTIGVIGDRPVGFDPCGYDSAALAGLTGVKVERKELEDLFSSAAAVPAPVVAATRQRATDALGSLDDLDQEALDKSLSLYGGLKGLISDGGWSGVATRCWPECFTDYGGAACSPQSMLIDDGIPGTCEADVYGNVTALLLQHVAGEPSFVADVVEMDTDGDTGVMWHCGLAPMHMAPDDGSAVGTIHSNRKLPLLNEFALRPGRVTLARLSQAGGVQSLVIGGGTMLDAPLAFSGTAGVVQFDRPAPEVVATIMREGLEHHFGIVYGEYREELEALAAHWGIPVIDL